MTTTQTELVEAFKRLTAALSWLESQEPDGKQRANGIRHQLVTHVGNLCDGLAGKVARCPEHPGELAHNCRVHRSERIGRADWDEPRDQPMPPVPDDVKATEARMLGESETTG